MLNKRLKDLPVSKLTHAVKNIEAGTIPKDINKKDDSLLLKFKSFRFNTEDANNLHSLAICVNKKINTRRDCSDSQIIRGIINYLAHHEDEMEKILPYIKNIL